MSEDEKIPLESETPPAPADMETLEPIDPGHPAALPEIETTDVPDPEEPEVPVDEEAPPPQEESRARRAFRRFLRWTLGLIIIFGLGFLTAVFTVYNSKVSELGQAQTKIVDANQAATDLQAQITGLENDIAALNTQITALNGKIDTLEAENQALLDQQHGYELRIALLDARSDVVGAQVELYEGNLPQARILLENTGNTLTLIESLLPEDLQSVISALQGRLELAIGEIETDPETAIADLSILAGDLLEIENALFSE